MSKINNKVTLPVQQKRPPFTRKKTHPSGGTNHSLQFM